MSNYINDIEYSKDHIFEISSVINNSAYGHGFYDSVNIGKFSFNELEHGMKINNGNMIKKIICTNSSNRNAFYFLHIAKNSGISMQEDLKPFFIDEQCFVNQIQYINDEEMLNSKLISGHFAMYPFELFEKNNKKLNAITIIRNPVDRAISYFIFISKIFDIMLNKKTINLTNKEFDIFLSDSKNINFIKNFQTRSITSSLDISQCNRWSSLYLNEKINRFTVMSAMANNCDFIRYESDGSDWDLFLHKFNIIGTIDERQLFLNNVSSLLQKNNYNYNFNNIKKNVSSFKVEDIKKILTKDQINTIIELNKYDFELYEYIKNKGVYINDK